MPILSSCCFCFDLKVGSRIIGILTLIGSILNSLSLAGVCVMFVIMHIGVDTVDSVVKANTPPTVEDYDDEYVDVREEKGIPILQLVMDHIRTVAIIVYVMLALSLLSVITASMLIHGIKKNRRGLLLPYIVQEVLNILFLIFLVIWGFVVFGSNMTAVSSLLGMMVAVLLHVYLALVVLSQYQALGLIRMHEEISMK